MKRILSIFMGVCFLFGSNNKSFALSEKNAKLGTCIVTGVAAVASFFISRSECMEPESSFLFVGIVTGLVALLSRFILYEMTPTGMLKRAINIIKSLESEQLLCLAIHYGDDYQALLKSIYQQYFSSELPLLDAFDRLVHIRHNLDRAKMLLLHAQQEGIEFRNGESYGKYKDAADYYAHFLDTALIAIRQDPHWIHSLNARTLKQTRDAHRQADYAVELNSAANQTNACNGIR